MEAEPREFIGGATGHGRGRGWDLREAKSSNWKARGFGARGEAHRRRIEQVQRGGCKLVAVEFELAVARGRDGEGETSSVELVRVSTVLGGSFYRGSTSCPGLLPL